MFMTVGAVETRWLPGDMMSHHPDRPVFRDVLTHAAKLNAQTLERKASAANWLAKQYPAKAEQFYAVKNAAVQQLFKIPGYQPSILNAWLTTRGVLVSVGLAGTGWLLHVPFLALDADAQRKHGIFVAERARRQRWHFQARPRWRHPSSRRHRGPSDSRGSSGRPRGGK